jgi:glycosyltransferase involved in cell wall biosynthesis
MKPPDHDVPSGDRRMARLLMAALTQAGYSVELASRLRTFDKTGDLAFQQGMRENSEAEVTRLINRWSASPDEVPEAWFTYHVYHKAPDWIGPAICQHFDIPYYIAEASHAPKQLNGPWHMGYEGAEQAIRAADCVFHMTILDGACLAPLIAPENRLIFLPPFLDVESFLGALNKDYDVAQSIEKAGGYTGKANLLSVAMMRSGDKMQSYTELGQSLARLKSDNWQLIVVGDGEKRQEVEEVLSILGEKAVYLGTLELGQLAAVYSASDLYVWPAAGEAYGMAFLEAQCCGLPVVAGHVRGVPDVVKDGETGLLAPEGEGEAFATYIDKLLYSSDRRKQMSDAARRFVMEERSMSHAVDILKSQLRATD